MDLGTATMARTKGKEKRVGRPKSENPVGRLPVATLRGSQGFVDWLESVHRSSRISKSELIRLGLASLAKERGWPAPPEW
jgi:hypothetical protein